MTVLLLQPLDVVKTQMQLDANLGMCAAVSKIRKAHGVRGLWRGTTATLLRNVPGMALYFATLQRLRTAAETHELIPTGMARDAGIGALSRIIAGTLVLPQTVLKVNMERMPAGDGSLPRQIRLIYQRHGVVGFYRGWIWTMLRDAPSSAIYLMIYEKIKAETDANAVGARTLAATVASVGTTMLTHPFDVAKTRAQTDSAQRVGALRGFAPRVMRKLVSSVIIWNLYEALSASHAH